MAFPHLPNYYKPKQSPDRMQRRSWAKKQRFSLALENVKFDIAQHSPRQLLTGYLLRTRTLQTVSNRSNIHAADRSFASLAVRLSDFTFFKDSISSYLPGPVLRTVYNPRSLGDLHPLFVMALGFCATHTSSSGVTPCSKCGGIQRAEN